jgi:hypothetical protein
VVESTTGAEPERTELALLSIDDSSDAALDAAAVTITPGAVSVMVMAMVSAWPEKAGSVIDVTYPYPLLDTKP